MRKYFFLSILFIVVLTSCRQNDQQQERRTTLNIVATRNYVETLGELTRDQFETRHKCRIAFRISENAGSILDTLRAEKMYRKTDLIVGLGSVYKDIVLADSVLSPFIPEREYAVPVKHRVCKDGFLTPYQYTYVGFIYDSTAVHNPPETFGQITDHNWKDTIILPDPFMTNVGKGFYRMTAVFGNAFGFPKIWRSLKPNVKMLTDTEEEAFNRFMAGEALVAMVELTRFAHLYAEGETDRYQVYSLQEGGYQIHECAAIVKGAPKMNLAKRYIEYMMSKPFQSRIPRHSWKFPVHEKVELPEAFKVIELPVKEFSSKWGRDKNVTEDYLRRRWEREWLK